MLDRTMRSTGKYFFAALLTWGITLIPAMYYAYMQVLENRIVDELPARRLHRRALSKEIAIRISDQVRRDFNVNERSFVALKMGERPFLSEDARFPLTHREGERGEGTRVIISLLAAGTGS